MEYLPQTLEGLQAYADKYDNLLSKLDLIQKEEIKAVEALSKVDAAVMKSVSKRATARHGEVEGDGRNGRNSASRDKRRKALELIEQIQKQMELVDKKIYDHKHSHQVYQYDYLSYLSFKRPLPPERLRLYN